MPPRRWTPVGWICLCTLGCSTASYADDADREVADILATGQHAVLGDRMERVIRPTAEAPPPPAPATSADAAPAPPATEPAAAPQAAPQATPEPRKIDLQTALAVACEKNRDYLARREGLYRQGLSLSLARFQFTPQLRSTLAHVFTDAEDGTGSQRLAADFGVSQILPTGGVLSLDSGLGNTWTGRSATGTAFGELQHDAAVSLNLTQPLLRGAGYLVSHEALTQAEREFVYGIRDFELFRENFSIGIARAFFDLVSQQQTLANEETNLRQANFDRRQAEALLQVDRLAEVDVYRARRREIDAENGLLDARAAFERARDQFKIQLGLPTAEPIEIVSSDPPFEPVRFDVQTAIAAAKHNRLDLITERERIEDQERALRIAEDSLRPQLDLAMGLSFGAPADSSFGQALPDEWNASAGVTMTIPLQQKSQRNALRSTQIALAESRRAYEQTLDQVELEIKNQLRSLRSLEQQIELQRGQIEQEQRAVTVTQIRFESGDLDNRDLLEARQALISARNALIQFQANHFVSRLVLVRDLGLLFVDDAGLWR